MQMQSPKQNRWPKTLYLFSVFSLPISLSFPPPPLYLFLFAFHLSHFNSTLYYYSFYHTLVSITLVFILRFSHTVLLFLSLSLFLPLSIVPCFPFFSQWIFCLAYSLLVFRCLSISLCNFSLYLWLFLPLCLSAFLVCLSSLTLSLHLLLYLSPFSL